MASKLSQMENSTKVSLKMAKCMATVDTNGQTAASTEAIFKTIFNRDSVNSNGPTVDYTMDNGSRIKWKAKGRIRGQMDRNMKENI